MVKREIYIENQSQGLCVFLVALLYTKRKSLRLQVMRVLLDGKIALSTKGLSILMYHISSPALSVYILYACSFEYNKPLKFTASSRIFM